VLGFNGWWDHSDIIFVVWMAIKYKKFKCVKWVNKMNELNDVPTYNTKFLEHDSF
jgi:hypothetical protein